MDAVRAEQDSEIDERECEDAGIDQRRPKIMLFRRVFDGELRGNCVLLIAGQPRCGLRAIGQESERGKSKEERGEAFAAGLPVNGGGVGLNALSSMIYPTFIRSTGTGAAFAAARIGAMMGPAIAGYLIYIETPLPLIFLAGSLPALAAAATAFMLDRAMTPAAQAEMASRSALARH